MIDFTLDGKAIVSFNIVSSSKSKRKRLEMSLDDYLAITVASETVEELRVLLFTQVDRNEQAARVAAIGV